MASTEPDDPDDEEAAKWYWPYGDADFTDWLVEHGFERGRELPETYIVSG